MKTSALCLLLAAATGAGIGVGWFLWGNPEPLRAPAQISKITPPAPAPFPPAETGVHRGRGVTQVAVERSGALVAAELEKIKTMPGEEFAARMAGLWLSDDANPDTHLSRALYLSVCDADRGMAFWREHSRRKGLKLEENSILHPFFSTVAHNDGKRFIEKIIAAVPQTQVVSAVHGWAASAPEEAVEWFNALPENAPQYHSSTQGLMWGLAEKSPRTALYVFEQLKPADQTRDNAHNLTLSTMRNHGMKGLHEVVTGVTDEAQKRLLLTSAMGHAIGEQPPGEFVKWMAGPLESAPYIRENFEQMAGRWSSNSPDDAMAWLQQNALQSGNDTALTIVAASLARSGHRGDLAAWLAANPDTPGKAAIASGKFSAAGN